MIKGFFKWIGFGWIVLFELIGYVEVGFYGSDVVCVVVFVLVISIVNGIDVLVGFELIVEVDDVEGGYFYVEMLIIVN